MFEDALELNNLLEEMLEENLKEEKLEDHVILPIVANLIKSKTYLWTESIKKLNGYNTPEFTTILDGGPNKQELTNLEYTYFCKFVRIVAEITQQLYQLMRYANKQRTTKSVVRRPQDYIYGQLEESKVRLLHIYNGNPIKDQLEIYGEEINYTNQD